MRKQLSLACALTLACLCSKAQLVISGGSLTLGANATITVQGDFTSNADIQGTGKIIMNGTSPQLLNLNGSTVPNLEIESAAGVTLGSSAKIGSSLHLAAGSLSTNTGQPYELIAPVSATFSFNPGTEIIGKVRRDNWVNGSFVTFNGTDMKVSTNGGTAPTSVLVNMVPDGNPTGTEREVKRSFTFTSTGGSGYTADVTFPYKATELTANNNTESNLVPWYLVAGEWNAKLSGNTLNTGSDVVSTTGIPAAAFSTSEWKLADPVYRFNVNATLRGSWNGTTMSTALNAGGLIPLSQPYNTTPFNYAGTETVGAIPNANVVDWVLLELRKPASGLAADATSATIIGSKAAFLLNDGSIVDLDGVTPASFLIGKQGNAYITVRHRNHLGVMSVAKASSELGSYSNDFGILSNSYKQPDAPSDPTVLLAGGTKYGLWSGDANKNGSINATDVSVIKSAIANSASGYLLTDVNLSNSINGTDVSITKASLASSATGSSFARIAGEKTVKTSLPD